MMQEIEGKNKLSKHISLNLAINNVRKIIESKNTQCSWDSQRPLSSVGNPDSYGTVSSLSQSKHLDRRLVQEKQYVQLTFKNGEVKRFRTLKEEDVFEDSDGGVPEILKNNMT